MCPPSELSAFVLPAIYFPFKCNGAGGTAQITPQSRLALSKASSRVCNVTAGPPCTPAAVGVWAGRGQPKRCSEPSDVPHRSHVRSDFTRWKLWWSSRLQEPTSESARLRLPFICPHSSHLKAARDLFMPPSSWIQATGLSCSKWLGGYFLIISTRPRETKSSVCPKIVSYQMRSVSPFQIATLPKVKECWNSLIGLLSWILHFRQPEFSHGTSPLKMEGTPQRPCPTTANERNIPLLLDSLGPVAFKWVERSVHPCADQRGSFVFRATGKSANR